MTREEAIRCLSVHSSTNGSGLCTDEQHYKAKQMAIKALENHDEFMKRAYEQGKKDALSQEPTDTWSIKDVADTFKKHGLIREQEPCTDAVSREDAITAIRHAFSWAVPSNPSKEVREIFNKCKENLRELPSVTSKPIECDDAISREDAVHALRKALWDYEDKTEKQFRERDDLDYEEWYFHRIFVQAMNDEDVETICKLPSVTPKSGKWIPVSEKLPEERDWYLAVFKEKDTGYQLIPRVADYIGKGENKWRLIDEDGLVSEYRDLLECVAWMPLPKPYEPQESESDV